MAIGRHKFADHKDMLVLDSDTLDYFDGAQKSEPLLYNIPEFDDGCSAISDEGLCCW